MTVKGFSFALCNKGTTNHWCKLCSLCYWYLHSPTVLAANRSLDHSTKLCGVGLQGFSGGSIPSILCQQEVNHVNGIGCLLHGIHFPSVDQYYIQLHHIYVSQLQDECSFVSLRDVQRLLDVAEWFYQQKDHLYTAMGQLKPLPKVATCIRFKTLV